MIQGTPWSVLGNVAQRLGLPLRGVAHGLGLTPTASPTPVVEVAHAAPPNVVESPEQPLASHLSVEIYQDGVFRGDAGPSGLLSMPSIIEGRWTELGPMPLTLVERRNAPGVGSFWQARAVGNRVCLAWGDVPLDPDFEAYLIYWDSGLGGTPETLLVALPGFGALQYRTGALDAGTYQFALAYRDVAGNESALGSVVEVVVAPVPTAVDGLAITYDEVTRTAQVVFTPPATDAADVRAYLVFDNWVPGAEALAQHPNSEVGLERGVVYATPGDTEQTFTTPELWAGVWRFSVLGMNAGGVLGQGPEAVLHLVQDGPDLVEAAAPPDVPVLLDVAALPAGAFRARVRVSTETGLASLVLLENGAETETITLSGALEYRVDGQPRADGTTVTVGIRAKASATVFTDGNEIDFVADALAPSGDGILTGEACF